MRKLRESPAPILGKGKGIQAKPQIELAINQIFSDGLRARHGLPWTFADYIDAVERLKNWQHDLEHYAERRQKGKALPENWRGLISDLGLLLLPEFDGELKNAAKRIGTGAGCEALTDIFRLLRAAHEQCKEAIAKVSHHWRARNNIGY